MRAQMTRTAWIQGAKNAALCLIVVFLIMALLITPGAIALGGLSWTLVAVAFTEFYLGSLLLFFGSWLYGRAVAGRLILDCGPHPARTLFIMYAIALPLLLPFLLATLGHRFPYWSVLLVGGSFAVGGSGLFATFALGRLQIRDNGLWQYWGLAPWRNLLSYHWSDDNTLILEATGFGQLFRGALPVPPELRDKVERILAKRIAGSWQEEASEPDDDWPRPPTETGIKR